MADPATISTMCLRNSCSSEYPWWAVANVGPRLMPPHSMLSSSMSAMLTMSPKPSPLERSDGSSVSGCPTRDRRTSPSPARKGVPPSGARCYISARRLCYPEEKGGGDPCWGWGASAKVLRLRCGQPRSSPIPAMTSRLQRRFSARATHQPTFLQARVPPTRPPTRPPKPPPTRLSESQARCDTPRAPALEGHIQQQRNGLLQGVLVPAKASGAPVATRGIH